MRRLVRACVLCSACAGADMLFGACPWIATHRRAGTCSSLFVGGTESKRQLARVRGRRSGWLLADVAGCHHPSGPGTGHTRPAEGCSLAFGQRRPRIQLVLEMEV